ncbi:hypothetical protein [Streptomyces sp. NBC_01373]|uniref:hypothetical protein n=1 Tax=Streptomyces sp. NBC_01373 TaxID=2903843 RepID=UPI00225AB1A5|nr:hypothetical protein [Streptomyces sp. NBC_01373]MCX4699065.1 hypothetical protein [Streptomyces sp. NBC_01373]
MKHSTGETRREDAERTAHLLDLADLAFEYEPANEIAADFEAVVMEGLLTDTAVEIYPPSGHTYPRKD